MAARLTPASEQFSVGLKLPEPVWRPRPLFDGRIAFMTPAPGRPTPFGTFAESPETEPLRVASAEYGQVSSAPSSLAAGMPFPDQESARLTWAPAATADGRKWSMATPSPLPGDQVLVSAAPLSGDTVAPNAYGLYSLPQAGWSADPNATGALTPLFDDHELVDAEPVAVYSRPLLDGPIRVPTSGSPTTAGTLALATGQYTGPTGDLHAEQLTTSAAGADIPGNVASGGASPIIPLYPPGSLDKIVFYASNRDRFDDPDRPVVRGTLEKLHEVKVTDRGGIRTPMPVGAPTLLVGLGSDGKVASAEGAADAKGQRGKFYAFAGDHVSGTRPGGYHFCTGCHTGHTFPSGSLVERMK